MSLRPAPEKFREKQREQYNHLQEEVMEIAGENGRFGQELIDLFIFRTDIDKRSEFLTVKYDLEKIKGVQSCTIDLEDCDKVLRVEGENILKSTIVEEIARHGFFCEELAD